MTSIFMRLLGFILYTVSYVWVLPVYVLLGKKTVDKYIDWHLDTFNKYE